MRPSSWQGREKKIEEKEQRKHGHCTGHMNISRVFLLVLGEGSRELVSSARLNSHKSLA